MPNKDTVFRPLGDLANFTGEQYMCTGIVFSPETENNHFHGCPPYICITEEDIGGEFMNKEYYTEHYFEVPKMVAYYADTHIGYTMKGKESDKQKGRESLARDLKQLLNIE